MADYQKVEVGNAEAPQPFSEEDIKGLQEESEAQDLAMEAKAAEEEQREAAIVQETRPEWLPEKFDSPEDMAKAYSDLESEYTKSRQDGADEANEPDSGANISLESFAEFNKEFTETGDISEENREKAVAWGIPRDIVDAYISGQQAILDTQFNSIYSEVGGEERYEEMLGWAKENLPEGEQDAFNDAVVGGTSDQMMFAIRSLAGRWMSSTGATASQPLIQGDTGFAGASGAFRSTAELTAAMKDPRYGKDPAYRRDIENRLAHSNIL